MKALERMGEHMEVGIMYKQERSAKEVGRCSPWLYRTQK